MVVKQNMRVIKKESITYFLKCLKLWVIYDSRVFKISQYVLH